MMSSASTFRLKRRSALSSVSPSWSFTSATLHLHHRPGFRSALHSQPVRILLKASYGLFRLRRRLAVNQLFHQFFARLEARIPFCRDGDCFPGSRVAALALLPILHREASKPAQVNPFILSERLRDHLENRVNCDFRLGFPQFSLGRDLLN